MGPPGFSVAHLHVQSYMIYASKEVHAFFRLKGQQKSLKP